MVQALQLHRVHRNAEGHVLSKDTGFTIDLVPAMTAHSSLNHDDDIFESETGAVDSDKCGDKASGDSKMLYQSLSAINLTNFRVCSPRIERLTFGVKLDIDLFTSG